MNKVIEIHTRAPYEENGILNGNYVLDELLNSEKVLTIHNMKALYILLNITSREYMLAQLFHNSSISDVRKSLMFQSAHFVENGPNNRDLTLYMLLALYFGLRSGSSTWPEIIGLSRHVLWWKDSKTNKAIADEWADSYLPYLWKDPWKMTGEQRKHLKSTILSYFETQKWVKQSF